LTVELTLIFPSGVIMTPPLMPKATALWLIENTTLTFEQIADFCGLHTLEVQAIADGESGQGLKAFDPVLNGQISEENLKECMRNPQARLQLLTPSTHDKKHTRGHRYVPLSKRKERPDAIAWLLKHHPELSDQQIISLLSTTKATIDAVRHKTHWNAQNIKPRNPVTMELCTQEDLDAAIREAKEH
jgi:hypothetical protein